MEFRKLKEIVKKGGITYKQVARYDPPADSKKTTVTKDGKSIITPILPIAMYAVYGSPYEEDALTGYEVFKIRTMKGGEIGGNPIPPGEKFPSDEDVGKWSESFHGKGFEERAKNYFNQLTKEIDESCSNI